MDEKPKRRWFRFRLSTVLILTAIVAWAMATRPELDCQHVPSASVFARFGWILYVYTGPVLDNGGVDGYAITIQIPRTMIWPALALAAFLAWKTAWGVVESRRRSVSAGE